MPKPAPRRRDSNPCRSRGNEVHREKSILGKNVEWNSHEGHLSVSPFWSRSYLLKIISERGFVPPPNAKRLDGNAADLPLFTLILPVTLQRRKTVFPRLQTARWRISHLRSCSNAFLFSKSRFFSQLFLLWLVIGRSGAERRIASPTSIKQIGSLCQCRTASIDAAENMCSPTHHTMPDTVLLIVWFIARLLWNSTTSLFCQTGEKCWANTLDNYKENIRVSKVFSQPVIEEFTDSFFSPNQLDADDRGKLSEDRLFASVSLSVLSLVSSVRHKALRWFIIELSSSKTIWLNIDKERKREREKAKRRVDGKCEKGPLYLRLSDRRMLCTQVYHFTRTIFQYL